MDEIVASMDLENVVDRDSASDGLCRSRGAPCDGERRLGPGRGHARPAGGRRGQPRFEDAARGRRGLRQRLPGDAPGRRAGDGADRRPLHDRRLHSRAASTKPPIGQTVLAALDLVADASGFAQRSRVFAGNVVESGTLAQMLESLDAPPGALVVMDRGVATDERVAWLRGQGLRLPGGEPGGAAGVRRGEGGVHRAEVRRGRATGSGTVRGRPQGALGIDPRPGGTRKTTI